MTALVDSSHNTVAATMCSQMYSLRAAASHLMAGSRRSSTSSSFSSSFSSLDLLNQAIVRLQEIKTTLDGNIAHDLEQAKKFYLAGGRRLQAIEHMRRVHKSKLSKEHVMSAAFQLIAIRIEMEMATTSTAPVASTWETTRTRCTTGTPSCSMVSSSSKDERRRRDAVVRNILLKLLSVDVDERLPSDSTLMRKLARLSGSGKNRSA